VLVVDATSDVHDERGAGGVLNVIEPREHDTRATILALGESVGVPQIDQALEAVVGAITLGGLVVSGTIIPDWQPLPWAMLGLSTTAAGRTQLSCPRPAAAGLDDRHSEVDCPLSLGESGRPPLAGMPLPYRDL
jgi:hypothetical protein